jgi:hypothetical protein
MIGYDDLVYRCDKRVARITRFVCWRSAMSLRGLQGDMSGGAEEIKSEISEGQKNLNARQSEIESTWKEVRALVVRYGV